MEDYDLNNLSSESMLLIVTSTFGNGEAPDNGKVSDNLTRVILFLT